jgi:hypothetical protein
MIISLTAVASVAVAAVAARRADRLGSDMVYSTQEKLAAAILNNHRYRKTPRQHRTARVQ